MAGGLRTNDTESDEPAVSPAVPEGVVDGHAPPIAPDVPPEFSHIGSYTILRKLGQGGAGEVWLGYDPSLRRHLAIKLLKAQFQSKDELVARFLQEARITAQLNHPNIVAVFQVGQHMGHYFIAMEYLPRGSVRDELARRGQLDWREATLIVRDAVCGLGAAHEANIIHRDVNPGNLLQAENGTAKVGDFGLARLESSSSILTLPGKIFGTPSFIAPEQIRGSMVDTRADFYSLTCTYYALLSGHAPFSPPGENVTPDVLLYRHVHEPFPDAQREVPDLPAGVAAILARGSQRDPADRYQNAWEFYRDLESVLGSPAVVPPRPAAQAGEGVEAKKEGQSSKTWIVAEIFALARNWKKILATLAVSWTLVVFVPILALVGRHPTEGSFAELAFAARHNPYLPFELFVFRGWVPYLELWHRAYQRGSNDPNVPDWTPPPDQ